MKYLLDTNVCIVYLKGQNTNLRTRLESCPVEDLVICSVVRFELRYGALKSQRVTENLRQQELFLSQFPSLPFDDQAAEYCGQIRTELEMKGMPIGGYDLQIAAIAVANGLTLITHNVREFGRIQGLNFEDWENLLG